MNSHSPIAPTFESLPSEDSGLFGAPAGKGGEGGRRLVVIPVPWDATTSMGRGAALGPTAILRASHQVDTFDPAWGDLLALDSPQWLDTHSAWISEQNTLARSRRCPDPMPPAQRSEIHEACESIRSIVFRESLQKLQHGRIVGVVGGDHSVPLGLIEALGGTAPYAHEGFGILHLDAHHDLRPGFQGLPFSHASIMYNVLQRVDSVSHIVQVGIRDYSREEYQLAQDYARRGRLTAFYDHELTLRKSQGESWDQVVADIVKSLPTHVYISWDIDALDPSLCPSTGTPVPGGLSWGEVTRLLDRLVASGRRVIGFDLSEVGGPTDTNTHSWDANVGARALLKLCLASLQG